MQVSAIADSVREYVQEKSGVKPFNYDGYRNSQWIVIDYGTIYVHVFLPEYREYYNLEQLWNDAEMSELAVVAFEKATGNVIDELARTDYFTDTTD